MKSTATTVGTVLLFETGLCFVYFLNFPPFLEYDLLCFMRSLQAGYFDA